MRSSTQQNPSRFKNPKDMVSRYIPHKQQRHKLHRIRSQESENCDQGINMLKQNGNCIKEHNRVDSLNMTSKYYLEDSCKNTLNFQNQKQSPLHFFNRSLLLQTHKKSYKANRYRAQNLKEIILHGSRQSLACNNEAELNTRQSFSSKQAVMAKKRSCKQNEQLSKSNNSLLSSCSKKKQERPVRETQILLQNQYNQPLSHIRRMLTWQRQNHPKFGTNQSQFYNNFLQTRYRQKLKRSLEVQKQYYVKRDHVINPSNVRQSYATLFQWVSERLLNLDCLLQKEQIGPECAFQEQKRIMHSLIDQMSKMLEKQCVQKGLMVKLIQEHFIQKSNLQYEYLNYKTENQLQKYMQANNQIIFQHEQEKAQLQSKINDLRKQKDSRWKNMFMFIKDNRVLRRQKGKLLRAVRAQNNQVRSIQEELLKVQKQNQKYKLLLETYEQEESDHLKKYIKTNLSIIKLEKVIQQYPRKAKKVLMKDLQKLGTDQLKNLDSKIDFIIKTVNQTDVIIDDMADLQESDTNTMKLCFNVFCQTDMQTRQFGCNYDYYSKIVKKDMLTQTQHQGDIDIVSYTVDQVIKPKKKARIDQQLNENSCNDPSKNHVPKVMISMVRKTNKKNTLLDSERDIAKQTYKRQSYGISKENKTQQVKKQSPEISKGSKSPKQSNADQSIIKAQRHSKKGQQSRKSNKNTIKNIKSASNNIYHAFSMSVNLNGKVGFSRKESKEKQQNKLIKETVNEPFAYRKQAKPIQSSEDKLVKKLLFQSEDLQKKSYNIDCWQAQSQQQQDTVQIISEDKNQNKRLQILLQGKQRIQRPDQQHLRTSSLVRLSATKSRQKDQEQYRKTSRMITQYLDHYNPNGFLQQQLTHCQDKVTKMQNNRKQSKWKTNKSSIKSNRKSILNYQIHNRNQLLQAISMQEDKKDQDNNSNSQKQLEHKSSCVKIQCQNCIEQEPQQSSVCNILGTQNFTRQQQSSDIYCNDGVVEASRSKSKIDEEQIIKRNEQSRESQNDNHCIWNAPSQSDNISDNNTQFQSKSLIGSKAQRMANKGSIKISALHMPDSKKQFYNKQNNMLQKSQKKSRHKHFLSGLHQKGGKQNKNNGHDNFSSRFNSLRRADHLYSQFDLIAQQSQNAIQSQKQLQNTTNFPDASNTKQLLGHETKSAKNKQKHKISVKRFVTEAHQGSFGDDDSSSINIVIRRQKQASKVLQRISMNSIISKKSFNGTGALKNMFNIKANPNKSTLNNANNKGNKSLSPDIKNLKKRKNVSNVSALKAATHENKNYIETPAQKSQYLIENEKMDKNQNSKQFSTKAKLGKGQMQKFLIRINKMVYVKRKEILSNQQLSFKDFIELVAKLQYGNTSQVKRFVNTLNSYRISSFKSTKRQFSKCNRATTAQVNLNQLNENVLLKIQIPPPTHCNTLDPAMLFRRQVLISQAPSSNYLRPVGFNSLNTKINLKRQQNNSSSLRQEAFSDDSFFSAMTYCFNILLDEKRLPGPYLRQIFKVYSSLFEKAITHMQNANSVQATSNKIFSYQQYYKIDLKLAKNMVMSVLRNFFCQESAQKILDTYNFLNLQNYTYLKSKNNDLAQTTNVFECFIAIESTLRMASGLRDANQFVIASSLDYHYQYGVLSSRPTQLHSFLNQVLAGISTKSVISFGIITQLMYFLPTYRWANSSSLQKYIDQSPSIFQTNLKIKLQNQCYERGRQLKRTVIGNKGKARIEQSQMNLKDEVMSSYFSKDQQFKAEKYIHLARIKKLVNEAANCSIGSQSPKVNQNDEYVQQYEKKVISLHRLHIYCVRYKWQQMLNIMDSIQRQYRLYFGVYLQTEILDYFSILYGKAQNTCNQSNLGQKYRLTWSKIPFLHSQTQQELYHFFSFGKPFNKYLLMLTRLTSQILYINQKLLTGKNPIKALIPQCLTVINFAYAKLKISQKIDVDNIGIHSQGN